MAINHLTAIENQEASSAAFSLLNESLRSGAQVFKYHLIGWQGGSRRHTAYWLPRHDFWSVLEPSPPDNKRGPRRRFWNCFGTSDPATKAMLSITVEINPPHEGEDRRVAGLFVQDDKNHVYIAHGGKVGGGRKGIGQKTFQAFFRDRPWHEIKTRSGLRTALVLGPLRSPEFPAQVSDFVHAVAAFKLRAISD